MAGLASSVKVPSDRCPPGWQIWWSSSPGGEEVERMRLASAKLRAPMPPGAEQSVRSDSWLQRMAAGMSAGDLRSLAGDIPRKAWAPSRSGGAHPAESNRQPCRSSWL